MIIRSVLQCAGRTSTTSRKVATRGLFYSRFYSVMHAMQDAEDFEVTDPLQSPRTRRNLVKRDTSGLPLIKNIETEVDTRTGPPTQVEKGLASTAKFLIAIGETVEQCKKQLEITYNAKSKRRRLLLAKGVKDLNHDSVLQRQIDDIAKLESTLTDNHLLPRSELDLGHLTPNITNHTTSSKVLDSQLLNVLRDPAEAQLSRLADVLSTTTVAPTVKSFNIMISKLTRLRQNAAAWLVFQTMLRLKYQPDDYTLSSVLNLSIVSGSYTDFRKILLATRAQRRLDKTRKPDRKRKGRSLILMSTIIKGCIKFRHPRRAEIYLTLMDSEKIKPNLEITTAFLQAYAETRDWIRGRAQLQRLLTMREWDRMATAAAIALCRACEKGGREASIRAMARSRGVVVRNVGDDLATVPVDSKRKGLDVPNHFKIPGMNDVGALHKSSQSQRPEPVKTGKTGIFIGTRREALGRWA